MDDLNSKMEEQLERFKRLLDRFEAAWRAYEERTTEREKVSA